MAMISAKRISTLLIPLLRRTLVLPATVARPPGNELVPDTGGTITVRVRQPRTANVQNTPGADISGNITAINEVGVDVTLQHLYDAALITDEELSLSVVDFGAQVTEPQVAAVAAGCEDQVAAAMNGVTADETDLDGTNVKDKILAAREALSDAEVPAGDRFCAVSPSAATLVLGIEEFVRADATGAATALREAIIGRLFGFTFVESPALTGTSMVFYHRSGFAFAQRAPMAPRGAADSAVVTTDGLALRQILQYDPHRLSDQSVVSAFAGASVVDSNRVYKVTGA